MNQMKHNVVMSVQYDNPQPFGPG